MLSLNKKTRGFTLIELLVVIAIIGILAAIVLVSLSGARSKARDAVRQSDIRQISLAMEMYYDSHNGAYLTSGNIPDSIEDFLNPVPKDPSSTPSNPIPYGWVNNVDNPTKYCVYATLENKGTCTDKRYFAASHKGTKELCDNDFLGVSENNPDCWR